MKGKSNRGKRPGSKRPGSGRGPARKGAAAKRAAAPKGAAGPSARAAMSVATDAGNSVGRRVAAMAQAPLEVCANDGNLQAMLKVLRDPGEPVEVRLAALQTLQAASFSVVSFESCRGDYIAALRDVAEDNDPELRQRVLGLLAREKDGYAQGKLLAGLRNPDQALVPPEKALQLLSYDVHAEAYSAARAIVADPPNPLAKREALRLLAADGTAGPMFERVLRDKAEPPENRQIAASALHSIQPERLQANAREILLDASEHDDIKATSLTALTQFGDAAAIGGDEALLKSVGRLKSQASATVQQGAGRFLSKYGG